MRVGGWTSAGCHRRVSRSSRRAHEARSSCRPVSTPGRRSSISSRAPHPSRNQTIAPARTSIGTSVNKAGSGLTRGISDMIAPGLHMTLWIRRGVVTLVLLAGASVSALDQQGGGRGGGRGGVEEEDVILPNGKSQKDEILKAEFQQNLKDAAELADLAEQLKIDLEKNDRYILSMATLKKTDDIEKLARRIRARLRHNSHIPLLAPGGANPAGGSTGEDAGRGAARLRRLAELETRTRLAGDRPRGRSGRGYRFACAGIGYRGGECDPERHRGPGTRLHRRPRQLSRGGVLRHLAGAGFVGGGRRARRFAQGGDRYQPYLRGELHPRPRAVDLGPRQQADGGETVRRRTQPGVAARVGWRQRVDASPLAGATQTRRVPPLHRLRDQFAGVFALLLDPAHKVRCQ